MANDEKEMDDYLEGNPELSKQYRAANHTEPSAALDEKILSASREVVNSKNVSTGRIIRKPDWAVPVSIAAVITLSVSLVVTMQQETGRPLISEPVSGPYDYSDTRDTPDTELLSKDAAGKKQDRVEERIQTATESVPLMDTFNIDSDVQELKNEARSMKPAKKVLMKEKAASLISEDEILEEQLFPAAPVEMDALSSLERKRQSSQQDIELFKIKTLWEEGKQEEAKLMFEKFLQNNPDYSKDELQDILGGQLLQSLQTE